MELCVAERWVEDAVRAGAARTHLAALVRELTVRRLRDRITQKG